LERDSDNDSVHCAQHEYFEDKCQDIGKKIADLEQRQNESGKSIATWDTLRWILGFLIGALGWLYYNQVSIEKEIAREAGIYVRQIDWYQWKDEREKRLREWKDDVQRQIDDKEDKHAGDHDPPHVRLK